MIFFVSIGLLIIMTVLEPEGPWQILVSLSAAPLRLGVDDFWCRHHFFACGATAIVIPAAQPAYGLKYHIECLWILPSSYLSQGPQTGCTYKLANSTNWSDCRILRQIRGPFPSQSRQIPF